MNSILGEQSG